MVNKNKGSKWQKSTIAVALLLLLGGFTYSVHQKKDVVEGTTTIQDGQTPLSDGKNISNGYAETSSIVLNNKSNTNSQIVGDDTLPSTNGTDGTNQPISPSVPEVNPDSDDVIDEDANPSNPDDEIITPEQPDSDDVIIPEQPDSDVVTPEQPGEDVIMPENPSDSEGEVTPEQPGDEPVVSPEETVKLTAWNGIEWLNAQLNDSSSVVYNYFITRNTGSSLDSNGVNFAPAVNQAMAEAFGLDNVNNISWRIWKGSNSEGFNIFWADCSITGKGDREKIDGTVTKFNTVENQYQAGTASTIVNNEGIVAIWGGSFETNKEDKVPATKSQVKSVKNTVVNNANQSRDITADLQEETSISEIQTETVDSISQEESMETDNGNAVITEQTASENNKMHITQSSDALVLEKDVQTAE